MSDILQRVTGYGIDVTLDAAGTITIAGRTVSRMGYGTMRLTGPKIFGPPKDPDEAIRVLRAAVDAGVRVLDTAWYYGPDEAETLVRQALSPYPDDVLLVTKLGGARRDDASWYAAVTAPELRRGAERDLELLGVESVPVAHLRWMGDGGPSFEDALGTMIELQTEGKFERIGLSNITLEQLELALRHIEVATVSNSYGPLQRGDDPVLDRCTTEGIAYLPFFPLASGKSDADETLSRVAARLHASPSQVAIAWLLHRAPNVVPIPGTSSTTHLAENLAAADLLLSATDVAELGGAAQLSNVRP